MGLERIIQERVSSQKVAIRDETTSITYGDLTHAVHDLAQKYHSYGVRKGSVVGLFGPKTVEYVIHLLAVSEAGGIVIPLNHEMDLKTLYRVVEHSRLEFFLTPTRRGDLNGLQLIERAEAPIKFFTFEGVQRARVEKSRTLSSTTPQEPSVIVYTSGSTGTPKGVCLSRNNVFLAALSSLKHFSVKQSDVVLCLLPLCFDTGLNQLMVSLVTGATLVLHTPIWWNDVPKLVEEHGVTTLVGVPTVFRRLTDPEITWGRVKPKKIASTGAKTFPDLFQRMIEVFPDAEIRLMYGQTESFRTLSTVPSETRECAPSVGKTPFPGTSIKIVVEEKGKKRLARPFEVGEIYHYAGKLTALGYWNEARLSHKVFFQEKGVRGVKTGDLAYRNEAGYVFIVGRKDDLFKFKGCLITTTQIEEELSHRGLDSVVVPSETREDEFYIVVEKSPSHTPIEGGVYVEIGEFPTLSNGKINRKKVKTLVKTTVRV